MAATGQIRKRADPSIPVQTPGSRVSPVARGSNLAGYPHGCAFAVRILAEEFALSAGIGNNPRRLGIRLNQPGVPIFVIVQQSPIAFRVHLSRPNHLRMVDVGRVVDPLGIEMIGAVTNDRKLRSRVAF